MRDGSTHQNKKKSIIHGSGNAYFLRSVHLSIVADDVWLWVRLRDRQGKHRGNKYCMGRVVASEIRQGKWVHCRGRTSRWAPPQTSVMNGRQVERLLWTSVQVTDSTYAFPDPGVMVFFYIVIYTTTSHNIGHFVFSHYEQVYRTQKVCVSGPMFIGLFFFFLVLVGTITSQNIHHLFF